MWVYFLGGLWGGGGCGCVCVLLYFVFCFVRFVGVFLCVGGFFFGGGLCDCVGGLVWGVVCVCVNDALNIYQRLYRRQIDRRPYRALIPLRYALMP